MSKLKRFLFPTEEEDVPSNPNKSPQPPVKNELKNQGPQSVNTVPTKTSVAPLETALFSPITYEEAETIANEMMNHKNVIVSIDKLAGDETKRAIAIRLIDFLCGTAFAIGVEVKKVNEYAFLFEQTPISQQFKRP